MSAAAKESTPTPNALRRLQQELADVTENPIEGIKIHSVGENIFIWKVAIFGAPGTIYQTLTFPPKYPFEPPSMRFDNPIFHPNVYKDGKVCISILHPPGHDMLSGESASERWNPAQGVRSIMLSVISMLNEPNTSSPANVDASVSYRKKMVQKSKEEAAKDGVKVPETEEEYVIKTKAKRVPVENEAGADDGDVGIEEEFYDA
uniref:UBIQUITIN_CONJUGAT_2 domain-containing protein n=1 Tax=Meloidogyne hapla TaxID=6305 RepID=A0A1I8B6H6_MELHA